MHEYAETSSSCDTKVNCELQQSAMPIASSSLRCCCVRTKNICLVSKMLDRPNPYWNEAKELKSLEYGGSGQSDEHRKLTAGDVNWNKKKKSEADEGKSSIAEVDQLNSSNPSIGYEES